MMPSATQSRSVRQLLAAYGIGATLPLVLLLAVLLYRSVHAERIELEHRLEHAARGLAEALDRNLDSSILLLDTLSTSPTLQRRDWRAFYDQVKAALRDRAYLVLIDATGRQIVNTYVPFGEAPEFTGDPATLNRMLASKGPVVSDLFTSLVVKGPVYNVSVPIRQGGKDVRYVMSLGLLPGTLEQILRDQQLDETWVSTIWDRNGVLMARSREHARFLGSQAPPAFAQRRPGVRAATNLDGEKSFLVAKGLSRAEWLVTVSVPMAVLETPVLWSLLVWGGAAALAAVAAGGLAVLFGARLEKPLVVAAHAARAFGRGADISHSPSGLSEVDELTRALEDAARRQRLMTRELTHRVKNILSVVQSLVSRSVIDGRTPRDARQQVFERIAALARAHDALVRTDWRGASLEEIVQAELAAFRSRAVVGGPMVFLKPAAVQSFALVLHELATNAAKYGALSAPGGNLSVSWETTGTGSERLLRLRWQERGGPAVAPPTSKGFGTTLLETAFGEHVPVIGYAREGFCYELSVPLAEVAGAATDAARAAE